MRKYPDKYGKERSEYIKEYWSQCSFKINQLIRDFHFLLVAYKEALQNESQAHTKPKLTDFRKIFLSLANRSNEILIPLNNGSINFPSVDTLSDEERNTDIIAFCSKEETTKRIQPR